MSAADIADFFWDTATVETYSGTNGVGQDTFAAAVTLSPTNGTGVFSENTRKMVRTANGEQVISETTLYTYVGAAGLFTPNSRVTFADGTVTRVIKANQNNSGPLDLPDHVAVNLE